LADGRRIRTGLAYLYIKMNTDHIFTLVSYDGCTMPLLGFDVMRVLGLQVYPSRKQLLKPVRRASLKHFILRAAWIGSRGALMVFDWVRRALRRRPVSQARQVSQPASQVVEPDERVVYAVKFAISMTICLSGLEVAHMAFLHT
jgi:hypothetical protein